MAKADIELLFGVQGGGSVSGKSGQLIRGQLLGIQNGLNKTPLEIKAKLDQASIAAIKAQINVLKNEAAKAGNVTTPVQNIQGTQSMVDSIKKANIETVKLINQQKKLASMSSSLSSTFNKFGKISSKLSADEVQRITQEYERLDRVIKKMS